MPDDRMEIQGRWRVRFGPYTWEYRFNADGTVQWKDPFNNQTGSGRWALAPKIVYLSWNNSSTKESWNRSIRPTNQPGWIEASYRTGPLLADKLDEVIPPDSATIPQFEIDPQTGEYLDFDPAANPAYIERVFTAVACGITPEGYYIYCKGMDLPVYVTEDRVDYGLSKVERETSEVFDTFAQAQSAAHDSAGRRRIAYFKGAGGAVIAPTLFGPATTPELYATILAVRSLSEKFAQIMVTSIIVAIGLIGTPTPMQIKGNQTGRMARRRGAVEPPRPKQIPAIPVRPRPRATRAQLQDIVSNPRDYLTYRTRNPDVAANQTVTFTGETNPSAQPVIHAFQGKGSPGYGEYAVTVRADKVAARPIAGRAEEFHILNDIEPGDSIWWHENDISGIKKH